MPSRFGPQKKHLYDMFFYMYIPFFIAGVVGIYAKLSLMEKYWLSIARFLDEDSVPTKEALQYFSLDVLFNFLFIPLLFIIIVATFFKKYYLRASSLIASFLIIFYFFQFRAQNQIGQYLSFDELYEAFLFALSSSDLAVQYVNAGGVIKLLFVLCIIVAFSIIVSIKQKPLWLVYALNIGKVSLAVLVFISISISLVFYPTKTTGLKLSVIQKIISVEIFSNSVYSKRPVSLDQALSSYRDFSNTPHVLKESSFPGSASNSNLIYFVMETGPLDVLPRYGRELIPKDILGNTLIAKQHHTTYPYTSDAIFSLLSGLYPEGRRNFVKKNKKYNGVFKKLSDKGYATRSYTSDIYNAEVDELMLYEFGIEELFVAKRNLDNSPTLMEAKRLALKASKKVLSNSPYFKKERLMEFEEALFYDLYAFQKMKDDIVKSIRSGEKFASLYLPQIGHGPWFKLGVEGNQKGYGRHLMKLQASWLEEIVLLLKKEGVLEETVIVLTSDHGVRTKAEDPTLKVGVVNHYTFRVPLIIYSRQGFKIPVVVEKITSHIDVEPSISSLLGLHSGLSKTEGFPFWEESPGRRVYFFSTGYGGIESFYDGDFYMNNIVADIQYKSTLMYPSAKEKRLRTKKEQDYVLKGLSDFRIHHAGIMSNLE